MFTADSLSNNRTVCLCFLFQINRHIARVILPHRTFLCVWYFLPSYVFGGVVLVTHYKCQRDLSPKPVHLLLGASGPWWRAHRCRHPAPTRWLSLLICSLSLSPSAFHSRRTGIFSWFISSNLRRFSGTPPRVPLWARTLSWLQGAFTAGLILVNQYVTLRPIRAVAVCWYQGMAAKQTD